MRYELSAHLVRRLGQNFVRQRRFEGKKVGFEMVGTPRSYVTALARKAHIFNTSIALRCAIASKVAAP